MELKSLSPRPSWLILQTQPTQCSMLYNMSCTACEEQASTACMGMLARLVPQQHAVSTERRILTSQPRQAWHDMAYRMQSTLCTYADIVLAKHIRTASREAYCANETSYFVDLKGPLAGHAAPVIQLHDVASQVCGALGCLGSLQQHAQVLINGAGRQACKTKMRSFDGLYNIILFFTVAVFNRMCTRLSLAAHGAFYTNSTAPILDAVESASNMP